MPRYFYCCDNCKHEFDASMPIGIDAKDCPKCGSTNLQKLIPEFSSVFKNSQVSKAGENIRKIIEDNVKQKEGIGKDFQKIEKDFKK